ncbi:MAG: glycosyltransferase family 2 protein [Acidimicrobiales bacterium]
MSAIVVGYRSAGWLDRCLRSLLASSHRPLDVVYVDNASRDGSLDLPVLHLAGVVTIANTRNEGFAHACNQGIDLAPRLGAEFVFLVNPDTWTPPTLVAELVELATTVAGLGAVAPPQVDMDGCSLDAWEAKWSSDAIARSGGDVVYGGVVPPAPNGMDDLLDVDHVQGAALFAPLHALLSIGGFDSLYDTFYEEADLCRRLRARGLRVAVAPVTPIHHAGSAGSPPSWRREHLLRRNRYAYALTDPALHPRTLASVLWRWVRWDLRRGPAGDVTARAASLAVASVWLARHGPHLLRRRRQLTRTRPPARARSAP